MRWTLILLLAATLSAQVSTRPVTFEDIKASPNRNWLTYAGDYKGTRHSPLQQINRTNAANLVPKWTFHMETGRKLETVPIVYEGMMYVTNSNEINALDARSGRRIWGYRDERSTISRVNRGAAIHGDRVFFVTGDCHLVALHRITGALVWDKAYCDTKMGAFATVAPMVVKDAVIVGIGGGDTGTRGFLAAYSSATGEQLWRLHTVPGRGEPGSETWGPKTLDWGGAATWLSGTYDPDLNLIYWTTGNPWPDFYGGDRNGANLYSASLIAVNPDTGKLQWYFQFTPHDTHDWDAQGWPVLMDIPINGKPRKVVVHANRNGFFYVLDRVTGEYLRATPFVDKLDWATGIDAKGKPILVPGKDPTPNGNKACPCVRGASNWMSPTFHPETGLFYVVTLEQCDIYVSSAKDPKPMQNFAGGGGEQIPTEPGKFYLRALDPKTGKRVWEYPMTGPGVMWAGTVSTAGGVIFFGDDDNHLVAVDAKDGRHLWHYNMGQPVFASPITYEVGGKQYVTIASQTDIFTFGLHEPLTSVPVLEGLRKLQ